MPTNTELFRLANLPENKTFSGLLANATLMESFEPFVISKYLGMELNYYVAVALYSGSLPAPWRRPAGYPNNPAHVGDWIFSEYVLVGESQVNLSSEHVAALTTAWNAKTLTPGDFAASATACIAGVSQQAGFWREALGQPKKEADLAKFRSHQQGKIIGTRVGGGHLAGRFVLYGKSADAKPVLLVSSAIAKEIKPEYIEIVKGLGCHEETKGIWAQGTEGGTSTFWVEGGAGNAKIFNRALSAMNIDANAVAGTKAEVEAKILGVAPKQSAKLQEALDGIRSHQRGKIDGTGTLGGNHTAGRFVLYSTSADKYPVLLVSSKIDKDIDPKYTSSMEGALRGGVGKRGIWARVTVGGSSRFMVEGDAANATVFEQALDRMKVRGEAVGGTEADVKAMVVGVAPKKAAKLEEAKRPEGGDARIKLVATIVYLKPNDGQESEVLAWEAAKAPLQKMSATLCTRAKEAFRAPQFQVPLARIKQISGACKFWVVLYANTDLLNKQPEAFGGLYLYRGLRKPVLTLDPRTKKPQDGWAVLVAHTIKIC